MSLSLIVMGASGRMGTSVTTLAREQGIPVAAMLERPDRVDVLKNIAPQNCLVGSDADQLFPQAAGAVVIDFTAPEASLHTARVAAKCGNPVVIGTTGFSADQRAELENLARTARLFWAPNMSVGINVLLELLPRLTRMLGPEYDLEMVELHHNRKKDSPSGTALRKPATGSWRRWPAAIGKASSANARNVKSVSRPCAAATWWACTPYILWGMENGSK